MARRLRLEYAGAVHHVMARGNGGQAVFLNDEDHSQFLELLSRNAIEYDWTVFAWCLMENHYHLLTQIHEPTLSKGFQ
jgi:putative transposase